MSNKISTTIELNNTIGNLNTLKISTSKNQTNKKLETCVSVCAVDSDNIETFRIFNDFFKVTERTENRSTEKTRSSQHMRTIEKLGNILDEIREHYKAKGYYIGIDDDLVESQVVKRFGISVFLKKREYPSPSNRNGTCAKCHSFVCMGNCDNVTVESLCEKFNLVDEKGSPLPVAMEVLSAYSDMHDELDCERNLDFRSKNSVDGELLVKIMSRIVPSYNAFDGHKTCETIVKMFGKSAQYYIAREGSVCIYVKSSPGMVWLNRYAHDADEFSYHSDGTFRLWYD